MAEKEYHQRWEWDLQSSPEALWPLVADTNRFNRDTRLPGVQDLTSANPELVNGRRYIGLTQNFLSLSWIETPFEWSYPSRFSVDRFYESGPLEYACYAAELHPLPDGGTRLVYQVRAQPRNWLGRLLIPLGLKYVAGPRFAETFARYDKIAQAGSLPVPAPGSGKLSSGGAERLEAAADGLRRQSVPDELVRQLTDLIREADELTLARLRPYTLADHWDIPRRDVLELFLRATRAGLLDLQWDLLCPSCRGAAHSHDHLADIEGEAHCPSCNVDFAVNFEHSVELTFIPNPAIRQVAVQAYCVGGPQLTPHVVAQKLLPPGSRYTVTPTLEEGRYRLRTPSLPGSQPIRVTAVADPETVLPIHPDGWTNREIEIIPTPTLHIDNRSDEEQLVILERTAWSDQAVTAAEVTTLQQFRDLFSNEALRPGEQFSVGSLTILFTDLRDSTRMYREIGDAPAFGLVMDHFDILRRAIAAEDGAVVKTIGDAVMAVFRRPISALRAIMAAQEGLAHPPDGQRPLLLKAGIHTGACIAVTLNERLDYFGSTVNLAARLEKFSQGGDVIISHAVQADPEVEAYLAGEADLDAASFQQQLRGFERETFTLWRISMMPAPAQLGESSTAP